MSLTIALQGKVWNTDRHIRPAGPKLSPTIAIVGEYPEEEDVKVGIPFVGKMGGLLGSMLDKAGIRKGRCYVTTVFHERPPLGKPEYWAIEKVEAQARWEAVGNTGKYPAAFMMRDKVKNKQLYLEPERLDALDRLKKELEEVKPNLVIAIGNIACWALLNTASITKVRGTLVHSTLVDGLKVLPTYSPANVFKQWDLYPIALADFNKACRAQHSPLLQVPRRQIWLEPTLTDLWEFFNTYLVRSKCISVDVETQARQITCIGFGASAREALVVPFWDKDSLTDPNYWKTPSDEAKALRFVKAVLDLPNPKVFQNGLYDIQYQWKTWGLTLKGEVHDTMILHHALQPELQKGLGFLGSIYTEEPSWKHMRKRKSDTEKRDE